MENILDLVRVDDYCKGFGLSALHPLISVVDLSQGRFVAGGKSSSVRYHFYGVFLKQGQACTLKYGRRNYDYQDGTLVFVGPGQIVNIQGLEPDFRPQGHALLFHPELLLGTELGKQMKTYSYFSYDLNEALHISKRERQIVLDCFAMIRGELTQGTDRHSKGLITSNLELFLRYCTRFYQRQFMTRDLISRGVVHKLETSLLQYINSGKARELGIPTVGQFAREQNLSPNYFGDLIKKETGRSAQEYIQEKVIELAKQKIFELDKTVSEIAFDLGFKHPQHFSRFFKNKVGRSPNEYRTMN